MNIPYFSAKAMNEACAQGLEDAFKRVLTKQWFVLGEELEKFESAYAQWLGTKYAVGVGSGYDALFIALKALGIGPDDEVLVPTFTFTACFHSVSATGAKPVPIEIGSDGLIDPEKIEASISSKTKAIMAIHLYGRPCDLASILSIAKNHGLPVLEDNAQAQGAKINSQHTGTFGELSITSFYPTKNLGALGDGGAICTNNIEWYKKCRSLRNYGSEVKYKTTEMGVNSRLDELQAAFLSAKLPYLDQWQEERQQQARYYDKQLADLTEIRLPAKVDNGIHAYHIYALQTSKRNDLQSYLSKRGIGTLIHYPIPMHLQPAYKTLGFQKGSFPVSEMVAESSLSLPLYPGLSAKEQDYICKQIIDFCTKK